MLQPDKWIRRNATKGMIDPFVPNLVRELNGVLRLSYGTSSYGYDIRLSPTDFRIFRHLPGTIINPKQFNPDNLIPAQLHQDEFGSYFVLPGLSYGLGVSLERLQIPENITVICLGKSTYARCGIIANVTPGEAGWVGHLTLEFSNSSPADARIYVNEGVCQLLFLEGEPCGVTYSDRQGKYQDQPLSVVLPKV